MQYEATSFLDTLDIGKHVVFLYEKPAYGLMLEFHFIKNGLLKGEQFIYDLRCLFLRFPGSSLPGLACSFACSAGPRQRHPRTPRSRLQQALSQAPIDALARRLVSSLP